MITRAYDVVIVGGGIVGLTLASVLKKTNLSVAVIDEKNIETEWDQEQYHHRVSAINFASKKIFESLNIWHKLEEMRISPYNQMIVWDASGIGEIKFDAASINQVELGHIIENNVIQAALIQDLKKTNITFVNAKPIRLIRDSSHINLVLNNDSHIEAKLLIGADGAKSWVRQQMATKTTMHSYAQQALVTTVSTEIKHNRTAWQRFLPTGPLAFLPLTDEHISSIVWSVSDMKAEKLLALELSDFNHELNQAFENRLGLVKCLYQPHGFPLYKQHAQHYVEERIALIGDAAHVIHPLAGQGLNLGLLDASVLAATIINANNKKHDIGAQYILRRYQRWRKGNNTVMMEAMSGFKYLFGSKNPWLMMLRNLGLREVNNNMMLKQIFAANALGLHQGIID